MADKKIIHKLFLVKGQLKPACDPNDKGKWYHTKTGRVNCRLCLSGKRSKARHKDDLAGPP